MIAPGPWVALAALIPAMTGAPVPISAQTMLERTMLVLPLCSGGSVSVPLDRNAPPVDRTSPCCAKGCHSGDQRKKRFDRKQ